MLIKNKDRYRTPSSDSPADLLTASFQNAYSLVPSSQYFNKPHSLTNVVRQNYETLQRNDVLIMDGEMSSCFSFFVLTSFYLLITGVKVIVAPDHTHTQWDSSKRVISPSSKLLPAQHTTFTREKLPCPRRDSNPKYQ
jgi:hypothetical protein